MSMVKDLIILSFKTKFRSTEYQRNLLAFGILVIYFSVFLYRYVLKSFPVIDSLLNTSQITLFAVFLKIFPFLQLTDILIKIIFKNNSLYISPFFQILPVSKKSWNIYIVFRNVFNLWNFYLFIFFLPYLIRFATVNESLFVFILLWICSIFNNGICFWLKNYGSQLPIKTFIITSFYFVFLGCVYIFTHNNQYVDFIFISVALIILLVIFTIALYLSLFNQKKVYVAGSLVKQRMKFNKQEITLSFLKMEYIYIFRSKRLLLMLLFPTIVLLVGIPITGNDSDKNAIVYVQFLMVLFLILPTLTLGQYLLAIEANFFNGIWTKPILVKQLLETKYFFYMMLTGIYAAIVFPFVLYYHLNIFMFFSIVLYILFIFNLLLFPIVLYSKKLDLNYIAFGNTQGFAIIPIVYEFLLMYISFIFLQFIRSKSSNEWIFFIVISAMSVILFLLRKRFLSMISYLFIKRRHKIMHRYMYS